LQVPRSFPLASTRKRILVSPNDSTISSVLIHQSPETHRSCLAPKPENPLGFLEEYIPHAPDKASTLQEIAEQISAILELRRKRWFCSDPRNC
jgi:hypothetical protein